MRTEPSVARGRGCSGAALLGCTMLGALCGNWLPGVAQARAKDVELAPQAAQAAPPAGVGACAEALQSGYARFENFRSTWATASNEGWPLKDFGSSAEAAEKAALTAFDEQLQGQGGACAAQRAALVDTVRKEAMNVFLAQRLIAERRATDRLSTQLLDKMERRRGRLRVQEKMDLLRQEIQAYKSAVKSLLPAWASEGGDPHEASAELRLSQAQFAIEETSAGLALQNRWNKERLKRALSKRAQGVSVSLDPGLRVLVRPEGLGNLQIFGVGPAGPPDHPATVNVGVVNDGSIADVYREYPEPPLLAVQPAVKVNLNLR
eukprot:TRINITY_DN97632_c0_g1_i1.p1 TRINITY_DN97632_c0_g1~~TRINITY_DN97632_c0_g1_i1.p1  ORF type:complete len:338 (-),score=72.73 TRINITY_DN97632_c0_g1_i1:39-998(-)